MTEALSDQSRRTSTSTRAPWCRLAPVATSPWNMRWHMEGSYGGSPKLNSTKYHGLMTWMMWGISILGNLHLKIFKVMVTSVTSVQIWIWIWNLMVHICWYLLNIEGSIKNLWFSHILYHRSLSEWWMTHVYSFFGMDNPFLSLVFDGLQRNPSRISWISWSSAPSPGEFLQTIQMDEWWMGRN